MPSVHAIVPCLWFDSHAEEAARFYTAIFPNSQVGTISRYGEAGREIHGKDPGSVMTVEFDLAGQKFTALNGGPVFQFTEAISFQVMCETQADLDYFWERLSAGGNPKDQQCGWLKDQFGVSWQVVPTELPELLNQPDRAKSEKVMQALLQMKKLDIAALRTAAG